MTFLTILAALLVPLFIWLFWVITRPGPGVFLEPRDDEPGRVAEHAPHSTLADLRSKGAL